MKTIQEALENIDYPVCHPPYRGGDTKFVTFQLIGQDTILFAEGKEKETSVSYAVNVYCGSADIMKMTLDVKDALQYAGYIVTIEPETFEKEAGLHRIMMTAKAVGAIYG